MKRLNLKKITFILGSFAIGLVNAMFGAGGGIFAVWLLKGIYPNDTKRAHASAVAVVLCVSIVTAVNYLTHGYVKLSDVIYFLPGGLIGALLGTVTLSKISPRLLKKIFGIFMLWAGWRLLIK